MNHQQHHYPAVSSINAFEEQPLLPSTDTSGNNDHGNNSSGSLSHEGESESKVVPPVGNIVAPRLVSLDVFRGLTIWFMILVNNSEGSYAILEHADWNGLTIADFVMPFFLFIVGCSISQSIIPMKNRGVSKWELFKKALFRTCKLVALGIFLQGGNFPKYDLATLRLPGVLQRIAFGYFLVTCAVIFLPVINLSSIRDNKYLNNTIGVLVTYGSYWLTAASVFITFVCISYGLPIKDCNWARGQTSTQCNAASAIDTAILTPQHMYRWPTCKNANPPCKEFDPEGILTTFGSSLSCFFGLYFGFILYHYRAHRIRILHWLPLSVILLVTGIVMHFTGIPINKNLYSISYLFVMAGCAGLVLTLCYALVDVTSSSTKIPYYMAMPLICLGMNSIAIYAGDAFLPFGPIFGKHGSDAFIYYKQPQHNIANVYWDLLTSLFKQEFAALVFGLTDVTFWVLIAAWMYKKRCFIKI